MPRKPRRKLYRYGLSYIYAQGDYVEVNYFGNMGATLDKVKECVEHTFGKGTWEKLLKNKTFEAGNPDYGYTIRGYI